MIIRYSKKYFSALLFLCIFMTAAEKSIVPEHFYSAPKSTAAGILFSDQLSNGLFLATNSGTAVISQMPGSGLYYSVSSDGQFAGFKEVDEKGIQIPILYDLVKNMRIILHTGSAKIGQISFTRDGSTAFTVDNDLIIITNGVKKEYTLGTYSNIAPISPDGKFVAFNDQTDQLWMMNLSTLEKTRITDNIGGFAFPQWSPNGLQLLYSRLNGTLIVYSLLNKASIVLGEGDSPSWIDNSTIVYSRKVIEHQQLISSDLFSIKSDGKEKKQLTSTADIFEIDPSYDAPTHSIIYSDVKRGGICSRTLSEDLTLNDESVVFSYNNSPIEKNGAMKSVSPEPPKTAAAAYFEMPYVHQVWDTPDWYNGSSACGATSSIMVIAYYNIVPKWNVWCSASSPSSGHNSPYGNYVCEQYTYREIPYSSMASDPNGKPSYGGYGFMWTGSFSPYSRTVDYYTNHGMSAVRYDSNAAFFSTVIANVDSGYPFTLCNGLTTAGHIIVVNGYDVNNRTLIVNDPYGNKNTGSYPSLNGKGVKYDWVGYNNGYRNLNRIYWGVSVKYNAAPQADTLVDDAHLDKGFFLCTSSPSSLTWWYDKRTGGYYNGHFWWTRTKLSDTCFATWTPNLPKDGLYEVSAFIPYSDATVAKYKVSAKDSLFDVVIDQKKVKNDWVSLGTFPFLKGQTGSVRLGDGSDTTKQGIVFDAVKWNYRGGLPTFVTEKNTAPNAFSLAQNFPNPFNPSTIIEYQLPERANVSLKLFDILGKEVANLIEEEQIAGSHEYRLSASRFQLSSGVYFYTLHASPYSETKRMIILK